MRYKVGDKVRVKENLQVGQVYGNQEFVCYMEKYKGLVTQIKGVTTSNCYHLECDIKEWLWTDEMLEPVKFTKQHLQTGDVVELRCGYLYVFVNEEFGFVALTEDKIGTTDNLVSYQIINEDFKHYDCVEELDVVKVHRLKSGNLICFDFAKHELKRRFDVIWQEEKPKQYYTLEEASAFGKPIKHKEATMFCFSPLEALKNAIVYTNKSMFELLKLQEFEIEE